MKILKVIKPNTNNTYYYPICNIISLEKYCYNENKDYSIKVSLTDGRVINFSTVASKISIIDDLEINLYKGDIL